MNEQKEPGMSMNEARDIIIARLAEERRAAWIAEDTVKDGEPSKICTKCGRELPLRAYHVRRRSPDGRRSRCKACSCAEYRDRYRTDAKFKSRRIEYVKKMYLRQNRPERYRFWVHVWKRRNELAAAQGGAPVYVGAGQVARDLAALTETGKIDMENGQESA